jgi:hypothetical protein
MFDARRGIGAGQEAVTPLDADAERAQRYDLIRRGRRGSHRRVGRLWTGRPDEHARNTADQRHAPSTEDGIRARDPVAARVLDIQAVGSLTETLVADTGGAGGVAAEKFAVRERGTNEQAWERLHGDARGDLLAAVVVRYARIGCRPIGDRAGNRQPIPAVGHLHAGIPVQRIHQRHTVIRSRIADGE